MDHDRFAKLASAWQSILLSAAALAGGFWTWHTFRELWTAELATAAAREIQDRGSALEITINAEAAVTYVGGAGKQANKLVPAHVLLIRIDIENTGPQSRTLDLQQFPVSVGRKFSQHQPRPGYEYTEPAIGHQSEIQFPFLTIPPKTKTAINFVFPVANPGLYEINFRVPADNNSGNQILMDSSVKNEVKRRYFGAQSIINVMPTSINDYLVRPLADYSDFRNISGPLWHRGKKR